jgi:hypothetical protein
MGSATRHRQAFLKANPFCIFCGGSTPATTIEHCPPRALFQFRQWPVGFEFPACDACNGGTSDDDLMLSMAARMNPFDDSSDRDGRTAGLIQSVVREFPGIASRMVLSAAEARRENRRFGLRPPPGKLHQETGIARVPPEMRQAVNVVGAKLAKAVYHKYTGRTFPVTGCLLLHFFTNIGLIEKGHFPMVEQMRHLQGPVPDLVRTGNLLNDQFSYKLTMDAEGVVMVLQVLFGKAFGFVVFAEPGAEKLEAMYKSFVDGSPDKRDFLEVIQSQALPLTSPWETTG